MSVLEKYIAGEEERNALQSLLTEICSYQPQGTGHTSRSCDNSDSRKAQMGKETLRFIRQKNKNSLREEMVLGLWDELYRCSRVWERSCLSDYFDRWEAADEIIRRNSFGRGDDYIKHPSDTLASFKELFCKIRLPSDSEVIEKLNGSCPDGFRSRLKDLSLMQTSLRAGHFCNKLPDLLTAMMDRFRNEFHRLMNGDDLFGLRKQVGYLSHLGEFFWLGESLDDEILQIILRILPALQIISDSLEPSNCLQGVATDIIQSFLYGGKRDSGEVPLLREVFLAGLDTLIGPIGSKRSAHASLEEHHVLLLKFRQKMTFSKVIYFPRLSEDADAEILANSVIADTACMLELMETVSKETGAVFQKVGGLRMKGDPDALRVIKENWARWYGQFKELKPNRLWDRHQIHFMKRCSWLDWRLSQGNIPKQELQARKLQEENGGLPPGVFVGFI